MSAEGSGVPLLVASRSLPSRDQSRVCHKGPGLRERGSEHVLLEPPSLHSPSENPSLG